MKRYIKSSTADIANKYNLIKISDMEWEVPESGVTIKKTTDDFGRDDYRIYSIDGEYITYATNFRTATIRAKSY